MGTVAILVPAIYEQLNNTQLVNISAFFAELGLF